MREMESGRTHRLGREAIHTAWDNALLPRVTVAPGETVVFQTLEPSQGLVARNIATGTCSAPTAAPDLIAVIVASAPPCRPRTPRTRRGAIR